MNSTSSILFTLFVCQFMFNGCATSSQIVQGLETDKVQQALAGEKGYVYLNNGDIIQVSTLSFSDNNILYTGYKKPYKQGQISIYDVSFIEITRPKPKGHGGKAFILGLGASIGIGAIVYRVSENHRGASCLTVCDFRGINAALTGVGSFFLVTWGLNQPARDKYILQIGTKGELSFIKESP